uniref:Uncharacterized protein n=1 Tax=Gorilla gorilla gorilla TaxID=9595 RepID=A0A2I2Y3P6_GORGO
MLRYGSLACSKRVFRRFSSWTQSPTWVRPPDYTTPVGRGGGWRPLESCGAQPARLSSHKTSDFQPPVMLHTLACQDNRRWLQVTGC